MWKKHIDKYEIDQNGRLRNSLTGRILKPKVNRKGYVFYGISIKGKYKDIIAHRAVAETFIQKKENSNQVNHKDCNKKNSYIKNLEWVTQKQNAEHASKNGLLKSVNKKKVLKLIGNKPIKKYDSILSAAKDVNGSDGHIHACCNGKRKSHKKYQWKYA